MNTIQHDDVSIVIDDILLSLGCTEGAPLHQLTDKQAAQVLGVKTSTLAVWRSTGRYNLPYVKVGRLVRYRIRDLATFLAKRSITHTSEE
ncbi:helix-turn-helix domain-containing protein [Citrobacter enshiensis]|uniref:helix-turn-helix domain-containing protein n=1 Tax=Citrobacter enshiensis TaxID=2971264 RepID=UPI0023E8AC94|nr:helix-turn-helix domain-containing protein [Citrobacter enshiensis]WET39887.1 helix-turn-helix domain-containing protein [Citrobacter enshiensis]